MADPPTKFAIIKYSMETYGQNLYLIVMIDNVTGLCALYALLFSFS